MGRDGSRGEDVDLDGLAEDEGTMISCLESGEDADGVLGLAPRLSPFV